ncbi:protein xmas-1-like [Drosophila teissieri]|uniref:protein xmas-1-like n=1 Tax=Drosophila teissieri TaxID=7243 RepID=UPI001CB9E26C|nr:protein xmas-1-like [Drosophila teissieri]
MKSIVAQTECQLRPLKVSGLVTALKTARGDQPGKSSAVCKLVAQMVAGQVKFQWTPHLTSLIERPDTSTRHLWRPYVSYSSRYARKLSGQMERRGSSISFLSRSLARKGQHSSSTCCVLPVKTRYAPKTLQGREWPIWRQSSMRPLLLPSSNLWTGVLSKRFYVPHVPRLRPLEEEEEVERRAVPQLRITKEQSEEEEQQLQRRKDGSRLRSECSDIYLSKEEQDYNERERENRRHRQPYVPSELMTPELATKWQTTNATGSDRERQLLDLGQQLKTRPSVRMTTHTWSSGSQRRQRSRRSSAQRNPIVSELEGWRRLSNHQPVPVFQGEPAEQEHLRHASSRTSARCMTEDQESCQMVWEPQKRSTWQRTQMTSSKSGQMPSIRAAKSAVMMAQEARNKHHRLITKELVYRPRRPVDAVEAEGTEDPDPRHRPTGGGRKMAKGAPERALLKQHLADLLPVSQPVDSFRIGYQPNAPTRQLLEQGKCYVSLRREQFIHLHPVRPNSLIHAADLEMRESPRQPVTTLHRRDGAKRPRPVEVVVKPSLLTVIRQNAATWDHNSRKVAAKRCDLVGVRPKEQAYLRRPVRNTSSVEAIVKAQRRPTSEPKSHTSASDYHRVASQRLPHVTSKLDISKAADPFKDLDEPRIKEKEVAASWKQAHVAGSNKYEASTSYRRRAYPGKKCTTKDMTDGYFLAKRSSSTAVIAQAASSRKVKPPKPPVVSPKVQVPSVLHKQRSHDRLGLEATKPEKLWR